MEEILNLKKNLESVQMENEMLKLSNQTLNQELNQRSSDLQRAMKEKNKPRRTEPLVRDSQLTPIPSSDLHNLINGRTTERKTSFHAITKMDSEKVEMHPENKLMRK